MSYTAAETGLVKSIKSKFENLNSFESLDISATVPNKYRKPSPKFLFKRSTTSIDLPSRIAVANKSPSDNASKLRRHNDVARTLSSDEFVGKKRNLDVIDKDTIKPLKEIKENVELRLMRHTNDPIKRSSIKRSPAFRVGEKTSSSSKNNFKPNRSDNEKSNGVASPTNVPPVVPKEFADKFEHFLKRCDIETRQDLQESGLTDTLKAFLRQPLPSGPPPKKPPRTFTDSPKQVQSAAESSDNEKTRSPNNGMQQKIDLLESQLALKTKPKGRNAMTKDKSPLSSSLLNCIQCSSASIYDTMNVKPNQFARPTSKEPSPEKNNKAPMRPRTEPIYMEPFAHLKHNANSVNGSPVGQPKPFSLSSSSSNHSCDAKFSSSMSNGSFDGPESLGSSLTSCTSCTADDHSITDLHDIHYMVSYAFQRCSEISAWYKLAKIIGKLVDIQFLSQILTTKYLTRNQRKR